MSTAHTEYARRLTAPVGVAALAACGCAAIWLGDPTTPGGPLPVCPTKALCLLHGNLFGALRYNALGLAAVGLLIWAYLAWTYGQLAGRRIRSWQHHRWAAPVLLIAVVAWFVVRNLGFGPFAALYV
jgi:hypothetical protein